MKKTLVLIFVVLITLTGCALFPKETSVKPEGKIQLSIGNSGMEPRTIQPDLDMTIATYDISGAGPDGTNFQKNGITENQVMLSALAPGLWTITVDAKNAAGTIIASGYTMVTVVEGTTVNASVTVTPLSGNGSLSLTLLWAPGSLTNPVVQATLTPKGGVTQPITFTVTDGTATYENNALPAGYYTLLVYLYDGTVFKWGAAEAVRILAGQTSMGSFPVVFSSGFGNVNLTIIPDLQNPIQVTFTGQQENLNIGTNMTITATTSEPVETYQWYLNGWPLEGETSATITIGSALAQGNYRLDLVVTKETIVSSGTVTFGVQIPATPTPTPTATATATPIPTVTTPMSQYLSNGTEHVHVVKNDGTLWSWGRNNFGQLGDGTQTVRYSPVLISGMTNIKEINSYYTHSMVVKTDDSLWAWGYNQYGQLGDGSTTDRYSPVLINGISDVKTVSTGYLHSVAVKNDGTVWTWGDNGYGQLGNGTFTGTRTVPGQVDGLTNVRTVAAGWKHTLILKEDGTVWAWGCNGNRQLGDGTAGDKSLPVQVSGLTDVVFIAAGYYHSLAIKADGTLWGWGNNDYGQLGIGNLTQQSTPVLINGISGVIAVKAHSYHTIALKSDGTVWTWGWNYRGQLGDGTTNDSQIPIQVSGLSSIKAVGTGFDFSVAIKSDNTVWTWGYNFFGELGDGTTTDSLVPIQNGFSQ